MEHCILTPLDPLHRNYLGASLFILGAIGAAVNGWLVGTFLFNTSSELNMKTHLLFLNLGVSCLGRCVLAGFPFAGTSILAGRWVFGEACCQFYAFLRQFFGVSQLATLSMLTVERFLVVCRPQIGSQLSLRSYILGTVLCWAAAIIWAMPPLVGWGRYGCDATGLVCGLDWSSERRGTSYNLCILILGAILPAAIVCICLWRAVSSVGKHFTPSTHVEMEPTAQRNLTKVMLIYLLHAQTVGVLVPSLFLLWLPYSLEVFWTLIGMPLPVALIILTPLSSETSTIMPTLVYLACDPGMRRALLGLINSPDDPNKRKKKKLKVTLLDVK